MYNRPSTHWLQSCMRLGGLHKHHSFELLKIPHVGVDYHKLKKVHCCKVYYVECSIKQKIFSLVVSPLFCKLPIFIQKINYVVRVLSYTVTWPGSVMYGRWLLHYSFKWSNLYVCLGLVYKKLSSFLALYIPSF